MSYILEALKKSERERLREKNTDRGGIDWQETPRPVSYKAILFIVGGAIFILNAAAWFWWYQSTHNNIVSPPTQWNEESSPTLLHNHTPSTQPFTQHQPSIEPIILPSSPVITTQHTPGSIDNLPASVDHSDSTASIAISSTSAQMGQTTAKDLVATDNTVGAISSTLLGTARQPLSPQGDSTHTSLAHTLSEVPDAQQLLSHTMTNTTSLSRAADPTIPFWENLPNPQRQLIPYIRITAQVFSPHNTHGRFIIANDEFLRQGDTMQNGIFVKEIFENEVVFRHQEQLFRIAVNEK